MIFRKGIQSQWTTETNPGTCARVQLYSLQFVYSENQSHAPLPEQRRIQSKFWKTRHGEAGINSVVDRKCADTPAHPLVYLANCFLLFSKITHQIFQAVAGGQDRKTRQICLIAEPCNNLMVTSMRRRQIFATHVSRSSLALYFALLSCLSCVFIHSPLRAHCIHEYRSHASH